MSKTETITKYRYLIFAIITIVQVGIMVFWGTQKSNLYWDEYFTLERAHYISSSTPYEHPIIEDPEFVSGKWLPISVIKDTLVVKRDESMLMDPLWKWGVRLLQTNNYSIFLNVTTALISDGKFSIWPSIILNIIIFVINQVVLFMMCKRLSEEKWLPVFVTSFYGFSSICISMVLFVRFYMLTTLMATLFTYFHILYYQTDDKNIIKKYFALILSYFFLIIGFKNAQFLAIYAGFFIISFSVFLIVKKGWLLFLWYGIPIYGGGLCYVLFETDYIQTLFKYCSDKESTGGAFFWVIENIEEFKIKFLPERLWDITNIFGSYLFGSIIIFILLVAVALVLTINKRKQKCNKCEIKNEIWVIAISTVLFFAFFTVFKLYDQVRYISYVFPELAIIVIAIIYYITNNKAIRYVISIGIIMACVLSVNMNAKVDMLYRDDKDDIQCIRDTGMDSIIICGDYNATHISYQSVLLVDDDAEFFVYDYKKPEELENLNNNEKGELLIISYGALNNEEVLNYLSDKNYQIDRIGYLYDFKIDRAVLCN